MGRMSDRAKEAIRAALRAQIEADLAAANEYEAEERGAAELDPVDSYADDDVAHADEAAELANLAQYAIAGDRASLDALAALDVSPTDVVRPGAVVAFGGQHYLVGLVARPFEVDGVSYEGIATDSPVYALIEGLGAGATFSVNGTDHRLESVR